MKNNKNTNKAKIEIPDDFSVPYPPQISPNEILDERSSDKLASKQPNKFFIYRKAFIKELKKRISIDNVSVTTLSPHISSSWAKEPRVVKEEYKKLSDEVGKLLKSKRKENFTLIFESPS